MATVEKALTGVGLRNYWTDPLAAVDLLLDQWKDVVYSVVDARSDSDRADRMQGLSSAESYLGMKDWGANPIMYSFSSGEGQVRPARARTVLG